MGLAYIIDCAPEEPAVINIYSKRWSAARGTHWRYERTCDFDFRHDWMDVFQKDEPDVEFILAPKPPRAPKGSR